MWLFRDPLPLHIHKLYAMVTYTQQALAPATLSSHPQGKKGQVKGSLLKMSLKIFPVNDENVSQLLLIPWTFIFWGKHCALWSEIFYYFTSHHHLLYMFPLLPQLSSIPKLVFLSKISHPLFAIPLAVLYLRSLPSRGISTILNWIFHVPHFSCSLLCHILAFKFVKHSWSLSHCHFKVVSRYTLVGFSKKVNANLGKLSYEQEICPIISSTIFVPEMGILKVIRVDLTFDW